MKGLAVRSMETLSTEDQNSAPKRNTIASTDNVTAESTAAPKKGRATARTKWPAATIAEETHVVVKQEPAMSALPNPPSPKRRRTANSIINDYLWAIIGSGVLH